MNVEVPVRERTVRLGKLETAGRPDSLGRDLVRR